jgi:nucleotide-binding universal stress UspA family protein
VPIDGSEHSKRALQEALEVAKMTGGAITLLNVRPIMCCSPVKQNDSEKDDGSSLLDEGQKLVEAAGVSVEKMLLEGNVVDQIVKIAKEGQFNLVVVGARGLSKLEEIMLGSVSHGVVANAPCPVIITK